MSPRTQHGLHRSSVGRRQPVVARRIALATTGALIAGAGMFVGVTSAAAAVPTFPDNLLVFPNRDFVSIEGYSEYVGKIATLEVSRPGVGIVGSATATVSGTDVAFEVNHPGGVCWGNGTNLKVTPDIVAGDVVSISIGGSRLGETTVQDAFVTGPAEVNGTKLTVTGSIAAGVTQANTEQRIIAPDLRTTALNRRDIRALPGPMTPAPRGGYSSGMTFDDVNHTFTATYEFADPAWAVIARDSALGPRMMSWEAVDLAGNRQGVTIGEFGEGGGPGFGGCPNGPTSSGPAAPTNVRAVNVSGGVKLSWTPAVAVAGTPAITGYRVTAVADTAAGVDTNVIGKRISSPTATGTTLTGLEALGPNYSIEVQSVSRPELLTFPPVTVTPEGDVTAPKITVSPEGRAFNSPQTVTLTSNEPNTDIYYTTNGLDPADGDVVLTGAVHYSGPIAINATTRLRFVAIDLADNVSTGDTTFTITADPPATPTGVTATLVSGTSATVSWTAGDTSASSYTVTAASATTGAVVPAPATVPGTTTTFSGLTPGAAYTFSVAATNANGTSTPSAASPAVIATTPPIVANAGPDQTITRTATSQNINLPGTGSTSADVEYKWTQLAPGNPADVVGIVQSTTNASASFTLPVFKSPMTNNPLTFRLTVTSKTNADDHKTDDVVISLKTDTVQFATAKWKAGDFRITGGGSSLAGDITIHANSPTGPVVGTPFKLTAAVAPATGGTFDLRLRGTTAPATAPRTLYIESTLGGTAGPFTVS